MFYICYVWRSNEFSREEIKHILSTTFDPTLSPVTSSKTNAWVHVLVKLNSGLWFQYIYVIIENSIQFVIDFQGYFDTFQST